ncbi:hypothetical protein Ssed_2271 [Shewanella sediminis HAW-EB3]|uniref:Uncharacterized protein n=1 Tax=Shewanella sediminis (strain HAW-EB3) TaxID=425104 RepID=A8FVK7_SHESH|nr:DUF6508 domain-containing protein [Shewanella sediminis]ABV36880.1 hypothetical protein Ssed_2271 [Shewanella sediminis HAW-EB3]
MQISDNFIKEIKAPSNHRVKMFLKDTRTCYQEEVNGVDRETLDFKAAVFIESAYKREVMLLGLDWGEWFNQTLSEMSLCEIPLWLKKASLADCLCCLTMIVRQSRFCDGSLARAISDGIVSALLVRLESLNS